MSIETTTPINIEEQRKWLQGYREKTGMSWSELAKRTAIPEGTISQFGGQKGYSGNEAPLAEKVVRFRHFLAAQDGLEVEPPEVPAFFETETSERLHRLFVMAQRGKMYYVALPSGCGKTSAARAFQTMYPNVVLTTMLPSSAGLMPASFANGCGGSPAKRAKGLYHR